MKQPWHTPGYLKISHALLYVGWSMNAGKLSQQDAVNVIDILVNAGKQIRRENE
jgi:hypothetical protein